MISILTRVVLNLGIDQRNADINISAFNLPNGRQFTDFPLVRGGHCLPNQASIPK